MNVPFCQSLKVADKVLAKVRTSMRTVKGDNETFYVTCLQNCREQGYVIDGTVYVYDDAHEHILGSRSFYASFAENRNSDNIVIYMGWTDQRDFSLHGFDKIPSDEVYEQAVYLDPGEYDKAGKLIADTMKAFLKNDRSGKFHYFYYGSVAVEVQKERLKKEKN
jgi:hypothetical protein